MALRGVQKPGAASPTEPGLVELATDAEAITGTATDKATTPANIQAKVASATAKGIVELLTDAEAVAGTDTTRSATAANMTAKMSAPGPIGDTTPAAGSFTTLDVSTHSMVRLNTVNGYGSTNNKIRRFTNTVTDTGSDITYADSATLGATFTINTTGIYAISFSDNYSAAAHVGLSLNSSQLTTQIAAITIADVLAVETTDAANSMANVSCTVALTATDVIRAHTLGTGTGTGYSMFTIARVR